MNIKRLLIESFILIMFLYIFFDMDERIIVLFIVIVIFIELFLGMDEEPKQTNKESLSCPCCKKSLTRFQILIGIWRNIKSKKYILECPLCGNTIAVYQLYFKKFFIVVSFSLSLVVMSLLIFKLYIFIPIMIIIGVIIFIFSLSYVPLSCDENNNENVLVKEFKEEKNLYTLLVILWIILFGYIFLLEKIT